MVLTFLCAAGFKLGSTKRWHLRASRVWARAHTGLDQLRGLEFEFFHHLVGVVDASGDLGGVAVA